MFREVAGCESVSRNGALNQFSHLVREQMAKERITIKSLVDEGVIKPSHRKGFFERIATGRLPMAEFLDVLEFTGINRIRAELAIYCFNDYREYFDASSQTAASIASYTIVSLKEEIADCDGVFEPIRDNLCENIARTNSKAIAKHHAAIEEYRNSPTALARAFS